MKKILALLLSILMLLSLAACTGTEVDVEKPSSVTGGELDSGNNEVNPDNNEKEPTKPNEPVSPTKVTIEEAVLLDEAGVKITAKSLDTDAFWGAEIKVLIENNSGKSLTIQCRESSVNGYMIDTMFSADVANGKKANDAISFSESEMELCGIKAIADMEFSFHIIDSESWDTYLDSELISVKTSAAASHTYSFDDSGELAYNGNGVKIVIKGLTDDTSIFGPSVITYIENTSNKSITVQVRDTSINGFMIDGMFSCEVGAGKHAIDTITFFDSDLEDNDITKIESIETYFHIFETDDWDTIADTNPVTINFS